MSDDRPNQCCCRKTVRSSQKSLQCDLCEVRYHSSCLKIDNSLIQIYTDVNTVVPWTCDACKQSIHVLRTENKRLTGENGELKQLNKTLVERMNAIENQIGLVKNEIKQELLLELRRNEINEPPIDFEQQISMAIREEKQKERKLMNLCVSGLPSSDLNSNDVSTFADICQQYLGIASSEIKAGVSQTLRVGNASENKPKLLILTFKTLDLKKKVLINSYKLKDFVTSSNMKVFVSPDYTPKQQEENRKLVEEMKMRRARGENVKIKGGKVISFSQRTSRTPA